MNIERVAISDLAEDSDNARMHRGGIAVTASTERGTPC